MRGLSEPERRLSLLDLLGSAGRNLAGEIEDRAEGIIALLEGNPLERLIDTAETRARVMTALDVYEAQEEAALTFLNSDRLLPLTALALRGPKGGDV